jgi:hypothetical protein
MEDLKQSDAKAFSWKLHLIVPLVIGALFLASLGSFLLPRPGPMFQHTYGRKDGEFLLRWQLIGPDQDNWGHWLFADYEDNLIVGISAWPAGFLSSFRKSSLS